jgi:hypothetical protein
MAKKQAAPDSLAVRLWRGLDPAKTSTLVWTAFILAAASALATLAVGFAHRQEWMGYQAGFGVLRWTVWTALAGGVLGLALIVLKKTGAGRRGLVLGVFAIVIAVAYDAVPAYYWWVVFPKVPRIHDITTDTDNPPAFAAIVPLRARYPNPATYDGPEAAALQKQAYPNLTTLKLAKPPAAVFSAAMDTVNALGLELVNASEKEGLIETSQKSLFFGFIDDTVVRIQADGAGSKVDVRSKAREGRSDFGVNANRVMKVLDGIKSRAG